MEHMQYWLGDLLEGIENDKANCAGLLKKCGEGCAKRNALPHMGGIKAEIGGTNDINKITEIIGRHTGAECLPTPGGFVITYNRGKKCDCALVSAGYVSSPAFCNCTLGFQETIWGAAFNKPVKVEILETFLRGGDRCSYKITLN